MQECKTNQRHKSGVAGQIIALKRLRKRDVKGGGIRRQFHREVGAITELSEIERELYSPQECTEGCIKMLHNPGCVNTVTKKNR
jgi:hypothetical protein